MVILHYSLGLSPQRSGGLIKYATDLIHEQQKTEEVYLIYPKGYGWWKCGSHIKFDNKIDGIQTIILKNSYPIPLLHGIKEPSDFYKKREIPIEELDSLFSIIHPDIFHVHTLMGLPISLLIYLKKKNVKIVYTSHDYFGLCPKVNFINEHGNECLQSDPQRCELCNYKSPSTLFLRLRNSYFVLNRRKIINKKLFNNISEYFQYRIKNILKTIYCICHVKVNTKNY